MIVDIQKCGKKNWHDRTNNIYILLHFDENLLFMILLLEIKLKTWKKRIFFLEKIPITFALSEKSERSTVVKV